LEVILETTCLKKYESHLDRVSTGSDSDLVQPLEFKILREYCLAITDQVATAPCTDPIHQDLTADLPPHSACLYKQIPSIPEESRDHKNILNNSPATRIPIV